MKLAWAPLALSDRNDIFSYIEAGSPRAAVLVDQRLVRAARSLLAFPGCGRPGRIAGTRELRVDRTPYVLAYVVQGEVMRALRILHGARTWPDDLDLDRNWQS